MLSRGWYFIDVFQDDIVLCVETASVGAGWVSEEGEMLPQIEHPPPAPRSAFKAETRDEWARRAATTLSNPDSDQSRWELEMSRW